MPVGPFLGFFLGPATSASSVGIAYSSSRRRSSAPLVILYADDLAETQRRLEGAGAKIVKPVFAFPGGRRFHFQDPDGYELAVWSDK
jgi:predicted enzyme related to lactoylglutathione lyase